MTTVRFYVDVLSPYAWIAWNTVPAVVARHGATLQPVPVLLAAMLQHGGTKGPAEIPAKRRWVFEDCARTTRRLGIPFQPPPSHPFNPLLALRVASAADDRVAVLDALFRAVWAGGGGVETPEAVEAALNRAGLDGGSLVAASAGAKDALRAQTEGAIAAGVFGVPTMVVGERLLWGADQVAELDRLLGGDDGLAGVDLAAWDAMPTGVVRRS